MKTILLITCIACFSQSGFSQELSNPYQENNIKEGLLVPTSEFNSLKTPEKKVIYGAMKSNYNSSTDIDLGIKYKAKPFGSNMNLQGLPEGIFRAFQK